MATEEPGGQNEVFFRALTENALELITVIDATGRIVYENPSNAKFVGYAPEEMRGRNVFDFIHEGDLPMIKAAFGVALTKRGAIPSVKFRMRHKDGSLRWIEAFGNNLLDNPDIHGLVVNSRDITEEVRDEERIRELNDLRNKFINIVAHQLRTPLSVIRWSLDSLMSDEMGKLKPAQKDALKTVYDADVEVIRRINDMLTALDIEEGRVTLRKERVALDDLGTPILAQLKQRCDVKEIALKYEGPRKDLPKIEVDAAKIRLVFSILADNAASYTPAGGKIAVRVTEKPPRIRFEIEDTGIGIPKEEQPKIFTRFYRASNASTTKQDASGIGLSIAKYFVEQHGGAVGFRSAEGKGSTFWFELPADA